MFLIRLLIIGDTGVGKTSLLVRFNDDNFLLDQKTTIGVDYKAKETKIGDEIVKLQIWDTAGQERFRSMTAAFYGKAQGVVVTFDVSQRATFEALQSWIQDVRDVAPESCQIMLCANKCDLPISRWQVSREEFRNFATSRGFQILECSASSGSNVQELFIELGQMVLTTNRPQLAEVEEDRDHGHSLILQDFMRRNKSKKRSGCCSIS